jgi:ABC-type sugar transport system ATPase subunit
MSRLGALHLPLHAEVAPGGELTLGLRPEALHLAQEGQAAQVEHLEFLGAEVLLHTRPAAQDVRLTARLPISVAAQLQRGDTLHLRADWSAALLFGACCRADLRPPGDVTPTPRNRHRGVVGRL